MLDFEEEPIVNHTPEKIEEDTPKEPPIEKETIKPIYKKLPIDQPIIPIKPEPIKPEPLKGKTGNYPILEKPKKKYFWKIYAIAITIITILAIGGLVFLIKEGYLTPKFNSTNEIINNNNYDFKPSISSPVSNDYENNFNNSIEINFDLSDEFIEKVCGNNT